MIRNKHRKDTKVINFDQILPKMNFAAAAIVIWRNAKIEESLF
jgi:hypothetical protein